MAEQKFVCTTLQKNVIGIEGKFVDKGESFIVKSNSSTPTYFDLEKSIGKHLTKTTSGPCMRAPWWNIKKL